MKRRRPLLCSLLALAVLTLLGLAVRTVYQEVRLPEWNRALIDAIQDNNAHEVSVLLARGADPNARDVPLDDRPIGQRLWDRIRGAPLQVDKGNTALFVALGRGDEDNFRPENVPLIQALLEAGARVNSTDETGETPLVWAAMAAKKETIRLLLVRGADVNARDQMGETALYSAASGRDPGLVQLLLSRGAQVNIANRFGHTPMESAVAPRPNDGTAPPDYEPTPGQTEIIGLLLDYGGDLEARDKDGDTPLLLTARYPVKAAVKLLLSRGANVNARDKTGRTPLGWANYYGDSEMIQILKPAGAKG